MDYFERCNARLTALTMLFTLGKAIDSRPLAYGIGMSIPHRRSTGASK